jgi:hypothetical protein
MSPVPEIPHLLCGNPAAALEFSPSRSFFLGTAAKVDHSRNSQPCLRKEVTRPACELGLGGRTGGPGKGVWGWR